MELENTQSSTIIFGFDSAWTDSPKAPGAICAIAFDALGQVEFHKPRLASFAEAFKFIEELRRNFTISIVALDQPTVVPNTTGKADQDRMDASICALIGLLWRAGPPAASVMLGDLESGYMITPLSDTIRPRLESAAQRRSVAFSAPL